MNVENCLLSEDCLAWLIPPLKSIPLEALQLDVWKISMVNDG